MRNIFRLFLGLVMATVLYSCSDRLDDYYTAEDLAGLKVHIQLPDYSRALVKTRALDADESINSVIVIAYKSDGGFISQQTVTPVNGVIKPSLPSGTASVAVVANYDHTFTEEETKSLASTLVSSTPDASKPICWGTASVNDLLTSSSPEISLLRMTAKVTVVNKADGFKLQGFKMCNTADKGTIAPADGKGDAYTTLVNDTRSFNTTTGDYSATSPLVFYETPSSVGSYLIVKGTYDNNDYYYKVKMYKDQKNSNDVIDLLRNHNYIVTINSVNDKGYSAPELAAANEAENRMSVTVIDDNPPIVDIISCKDYELGVCDTLNFLGTGDAIDENGNTKDKDGNPVRLNITVATSYKSKDAFTYDISTNDDSWITIDNSEAKMTTFDGSNGSAGSELNRGAKFVIPVTLKAANPSENSREGTVTVTAGDLTRTIIIKQAGYDFLADKNRKVQFFIDNTQKSDDYFGAFLPAVQGVSAADNQGLVRDHGLHFAAVNGNTYSYKVPHLKGDQLKNKDDSHISIVDGGEGDYYTVKLNDNNDESLWVSSFTITNKNNVTITYPVYHTGVFHEITETNANTWQLGPIEKDVMQTKTGWFYYGVVEVQGNGTGDGTNGSKLTYRLLDRNIGATSNGFYSPATQATKKNKGAVGAYIMLTKDKLAKTTSESTLGKDYMPFPDYFHIPEGDKSGDDDVDEITDLPITIEPKTTSAGETYYCYVIPTTGNYDKGVQPAQVYLPVTGYYEGTAFRNDNHANIWSRSRLSAYQGFSADSPEYGLWFLYLDINGQKRTKSNIRIVNGSAGRIGINGNGVDAIYNALPVRGIHKK